jgi:hypothetical protein
VRDTPKQVPVAPTSGDDAGTLVCRLFISTTGRVDNEMRMLQQQQEGELHASFNNQQQQTKMARLQNSACGF